MSPKGGTQMCAQILWGVDPNVDPNGDPISALCGPNMDPILPQDGPNINPIWSSPRCIRHRALRADGVTGPIREFLEILRVTMHSCIILPKVPFCVSN